MSCRGRGREDVTLLSYIGTLDETRSLFNLFTQLAMDEAKITTISFEKIWDCDWNFTSPHQKGDASAKIIGKFEPVLSKELGAEAL